MKRAASDAVMVMGFLSSLDIGKWLYRHTNGDTKRSSVIEPSCRK
jgi:hypothetical protein